MEGTTAYHLWEAAFGILCPSVRKTRFQTKLNHWILSSWWSWTSHSASMGLPWLICFVLVRYVLRIIGRLDKEVETHASILVWRIPWTEEPGGCTVYGVAESQIITTTIRKVFYNHESFWIRFRNDSSLCKDLSKF